MLKKTKFFFLLKLKSEILKHKYILIKQNPWKDINVTTFKANMKNINSVYSINWINVFHKFYYIIGLNNIYDVENYKQLDILAISYNGFFINSNYLKKLNNYLIFFTYNYRYYIQLIYYNIRNYILIIYNILIKLIISNLI